MNQPASRRLLLAGILLMTFLAALDGTVVGTLMPTVIADVGGLELYPWVGISFMLASMVAAPLYGKLSDLFGHRRFTFLAVALFVAGSALCGAARTMPELVVARGFQGLGAGGIFVMSLVVVGLVYPGPERGRVQGALSSVWGISSVVGPALGGLLVQWASWRWAFYLNLPVGVIAVLMLARTLKLPPHPVPTSLKIDGWGTFLFASGSFATMLGLLMGGQGRATLPVLGLLVLGVGLLALLIRHERRFSEPLLPLELFSFAPFRHAVLLGFLAAMALFAASTFVPLFVQGVLEASPTLTGTVLTANSLGWTIGATACGHMLARFGFRKLALGGMIAMLGGSALLAGEPLTTSPWWIARDLGLMGLGMGFVVTSALIAVQSFVARRQLGAATSTVQLFRNLGATLGLSVLGGIQLGSFRTQLAGLASQARLSGPSQAALAHALTHPQVVLEAGARAGLPREAVLLVQQALGTSIHVVFACLIVISGLGLALAWRMPTGSPQEPAS